VRQQETSNWLHSLESLLPWQHHGMCDLFPTHEHTLHACVLTITWPACHKPRWSCVCTVRISCTVHTRHGISISTVQNNLRLASLLKTPLDCGNCQQHGNR
jgi:hypothetical protein